MNLLALPDATVERILAYLEDKKERTANLLIAEIKQTARPATENTTDG